MIKISLTTTNKEMSIASILYSGLIDKNGMLKKC